MRLALLGLGVLMGSIAFDGVGDVVLALGSSRFGGEYYKLFRKALGIEACTVFAFRPRGGPRPLFVASDSPERRRQAWNLACDYSKGAFKHDPIVRANLPRTPREAAPLVYSLCADEVKDPGYRRHFYDEPALERKVGILGGVEDTIYYSNFYYGSAQGAGSESRELRLMGELAGLCVKLLRRHDIATFAPDPRSNDDAVAGHWHPSTLAHLRTVFLNGPYELSPREGEVCAQVVLGYSTLAIGLNLGISVNTVATYRKRAYLKLGISSQNELFERYFTTVNRMLAEGHRTRHE
jgi:DNA-binding CsgD family transcriptional regulator